MSKEPHAGEPSAARIEDAALRYLPHGGSAHLVPRVIDYGRDVMVCIGRFPADSPLVDDGRVPTFLAVEPAAQAAATHLALRAVEDGLAIEQLTGFLTGVRQMTMTRQWLPAEADLVIKVTLRSGARGFHRFDFEVALDGAPVCLGELTTFVDQQVHGNNTRTS
ncbi:MAG: hypothetical protein KDC87_18045 [Planctomycetes bacterium]|nr:hypothetical protein [Planctomycetota bacterium]MCB9872444.1 hypothetical protein [Planctomycetota bacterium]